MDYRYSSHTLFQMKYHFVWVTKYRYKVLSGEIHPTPPLTLAEKTQNRNCQPFAGGRQMTAADHSRNFNRLFYSNRLIVGKRLDHVVKNSIEIKNWLVHGLSSINVRVCAD
jgi:hypothetical protein